MSDDLGQFGKLGAGERIRASVPALLPKPEGGEPRRPGRPALRRRVRALYRVRPDTSRNETAGDVRVLRVSGPGQSRGRL
jgi:hypothetical protein